MNVFRLYADEWRGRRYFYVRVKVLPTRKAMLRRMRQDGWTAHSGVQGQCSGLTHISRRGRLTGLFAMIWLNREDLSANGSEIASHECVHAAMRHMANKKVDVTRMDESVHSGEECLAHTQGCLFRQLNTRLNEVGAYG